MACNVSFSIGFPFGGPVQVTCSGGVGTLSTAYGNITSSCRPSRVRGRINGGAWVMAPVVGSSFGGTYIATWTLRDIPGATCDNATDILEVEVEVTDGVNVSWVPANPVGFSAYCFMMPAPMRIDAAPLIELEAFNLVPPSLLWGVVASKLADTGAVKLKRVRGEGKMAAPGSAMWKSIGVAQGLWTLVLGAEKRAQLTLTVSGKIGGTTYKFEFLWGCGKFSPIKGGQFGPVGSNPITQVLSVRGRQGGPIAAGAKARAKTKARPALKKRRARR
jgi:hypothetical protein